MNLYKLMYINLFKDVAKAVVLLEQRKICEALECLKLAQQKTEELFVSAEEKGDGMSVLH